MGPKKGAKAVDANTVEKTPEELEAEALEALEEAKRAEEARVIEEARLNAEMEAKILRVAAEKAEVRRLEQEAFAVKKREDNERKIRFAEAKVLRDKEDAERAEAARVKMLEEEAKKRKREEENRLRKLEQARLKKLLDDKVCSISTAPRCTSFHPILIRVVHARRRRRRRRRRAPHCLRLSEHARSLALRLGVLLTPHCRTSSPPATIAILIAPPLPFVTPSSACCCCCC